MHQLSHIDPSLIIFLTKKRILTIPPILFNGTLIPHFKQKPGLFNSHFSSQFTPINTFSKIPVFTYQWENYLDAFDIKEKNIYLTIKNLISNKSHGRDDIFIKMIKLCSKSMHFL